MNYIDPDDRPTPAEAAADEAPLPRLCAWCGEFYCDHPEGTNCAGCGVLLETADDGTDTFCADCAATAGMGETL